MFYFEIRVLKTIYFYRPKRTFLVFEEKSTKQFFLCVLALEWFVGILIPTDDGLLIPTTQCHAFGTVKNGKNARL